VDKKEERQCGNCEYIVEDEKEENGVIVKRHYCTGKGLANLIDEEIHLDWVCTWHEYFNG
jgi:hypothetical protein